MTLYATENCPSVVLNPASTLVRFPGCGQIVQVFPASSMIRIPATYVYVGGTRSGSVSEPTVHTQTYRQSVRGAGSPAMSIAYPSIVRVGWIMKSTIRTVTFNECGIRHTWIIHHVSPLPPNKLESHSRIINGEVCVQLHTGDEG